MFKRFISYYRPHKTIFVLDMLASLLVALVGIVYPIITREMLNELIPHKQYRMIVLAGIGLLLLYVVRMLLNFFIQYYGHVMGVRMQAQMRSDMFRHLEKLPYSFYDNHETGKIMSRMTNDLMDISELAHHGPENLLISSISVIISFVYLSTINIWLTLIIFACVPFLILIAAFLRKKMRNAFMESRVSTAQINASLESSISGIRVTKAFTNADKEEEKFEEGNGMFVSARRKAYKAMGQFHSMTSFITDIFNVIILIAGGLFLYNGSIDFGDYSAFIVSVNLFISPVMTLINFMEQYQTGVTGFERFVEIMDQVPEEDTPGAVDIGTVEGDIEFRHVSYRYEDSNPVLDDADVPANRGHGHGVQLLAVDEDLAVLHVVEVGEEMADGGLTAARGAYQGIGLAFFDLEGEVVQDGHAVLVTVGDVTELDIALHLPDVHGAGSILLRLLVHDLHEALEARDAGLVLLHEVDQGHNGRDEKIDRDHEGRVIPQQDRAVVKEQTARNENDNVEHIGDEGGHGVELSHGLVGLAAGRNEHSVSLLEFLLLLIGVGEGLRNTDTRNAALK